MFAPVVGVVVSVLWNASAGDVWKTDAGYFFIKVDDVTQKHELLHKPWDFGVDLVRTGYHELWHWVHQPFTVGPSVTMLSASGGGHGSFGSPRPTPTLADHPTLALLEFGPS